MKTLIFGAISSMALVGLGVESANIVGYQSYEADVNGYANIAPAFTPLSASGEWVCQDKIYDKSVVGGDTVYMLETTVFDFNSFFFNGFLGDTSLGWDVTTWDPATFEPENTTVMSFNLAKGMPVYFVPGDVDIPTVSGQVEDINVVQQITFPDQITYEFSNPFPKPTTIADLNAFCVGGDTFYVLNTEIFDFKTYFCNGDGTWEISSPTWSDWEVTTTDDSTIVVFGAGEGGYYTPGDDSGRTWNVSL